MGITLVLLLALLLAFASVSAQGPLPFTEDFTGFTGSGFDPSPGAGQPVSLTAI